MNSTSSSPVIFSRWVSWLGVLMLGAGVSIASLSPSQAASPALSSASLQFSATDIAQGVLEGGTPVSYETGVEGWTREAFASLGLFGLEWDSLEGDTRRMTYSGSTESSSLIPALRDENPKNNKRILPTSTWYRLRLERKNSVVPAFPPIDNTGGG